MTEWLHLSKRASNHDAAPQPASIRAAIAIGLLMAGAVALQAQAPVAQTGTNAPAARGLVLVELFTSEGCPHCPDADALLERLYATQPVDGVEIVPLEEHVDYWDRPEWVDHFSAARYTERQKNYADAMDLDSVYTPQMVVDGLIEFVGNNEGRARAAISALGHALPASLRFSPAGPGPAGTGAAPKGQVRLGGQDITLSGPASVYLILAEDKLSSRVYGGSNAGENWKHSSIARWFYRVGRLRADEKNFSAGLALADPDAQWRLENLRLIAIVQDDESQKVAAIGVARWPEIFGPAPSSPAAVLPVPPAAPATSNIPGRLKP
jgi:hypothetical protein